jgi:hypothetical protein
MTKEEIEQRDAELDRLEQEAIEATGGCLAASKEWIEKRKKQREKKDEKTGL